MLFRFVHFNLQIERSQEKPLLVHVIALWELNASLLSLIKMELCIVLS